MEKSHPSDPIHRHTSPAQCACVRAYVCVRVCEREKEKEKNW